LAGAVEHEWSAGVALSVRRVVRTIFAAIGVVSICLVAPLAAQTGRRAASGDAQDAVRRKVNANTVSIVSGNITGSYARYAADIASVVDDGETMRVLPILGAGAVQNVTDIMYLRGVDMGFVRTDSVEAIRRKGVAGDVAKKVQYIAKLVDDEMHVIARKDITDLRQLDGKKVNIDVVGSGTHFSSELIFERLGMKVEPTSWEQTIAYEKLKSGEIDASIFFGGKPVGGVAGFADEAHRFHLVPAPYQRELEDYYLPASLTGADYPNLLGKDETIETISVSTLLAVYNLQPQNERYQRVTRFVDAFFSKFPDLQKPPRHPKWKDVNLAATVPGWTRFQPAQDWLDKHAAAAVAQPPQATERSAEEIEKFRRFVEQRRGKGPKKKGDEDPVRLYREYQEWSGKQ
jgi:uncharacterized protein